MFVKSLHLGTQIEKMVLCIGLVCSSLFTIQAQVTIGTDRAPAKAALLQIKDQEPGSSNQTSTTGGFVLPRVVLEDLTTLEPFLEPTDADYSSQKALNVGLLVYNVNATGGFAPGLYFWDGEAWAALSAVKKSNTDVVIINPDPEAPAVVTDPNGLTLSNSYMVTPGGTIDIPVIKAYAMWNQKLGANEVSLTGVQSVELLWQDTQSLITSVDIVDSSLGIKAKMRVKTSVTGLSGNAVVVFKVDGVIRWSWHLWVTGYDPTLSPVAADNGVVFMDRNLGAVTTAVGNIGAHGLLYQWGRKDPFPGAASNIENTTDHNLYNISNQIVSINKTSVAVANNLENAVKNPLTFYYSSSKDWVSNTADGRDNYLWGASKSSYDPCPKGWRVPVSGDGAASPWKNLSGQSFGSSSGPVWGEGKYYPAAGFRDAGNGNLTEVGTSGHVWSATAVEYGPVAYSLLFSSNNFNASVHWLNRGNGYSVRCAKE